MAEIPQSSFQGPLAPKIGLNDSFQNPIPGGPKIPPKRRNYAHFIPVGAIGLALLILPLTIQQLSQQQDVRQQASQPTPTVIQPTSAVSTPTPTLTVSTTPTASPSPSSVPVSNR